MDRAVCSSTGSTAQMRDVFLGEDGRVRKEMVHYNSYRIGESVHEYRGVKESVESREVQRLALLVPVDKSIKPKSRNAIDIKDIYSERLTSGILLFCSISQVVSQRTFFYVFTHYDSSFV